MNVKKGDRRRFLKEGAAMAGLTVGAIRLVSGQAPGSEGASTGAEGLRPAKHLPYGVPSRFETTIRGRNRTGSVRTPLQDLDGMITPSGLHFVISNGSAPSPDFDPRQHRLLIHGMVDRPLIFTMEELKRLPAVSRICFLECGANSSYRFLPGRGGTGPRTVDEAHGNTACSEWTGVLLSLLLAEVGVQPEASWLVAEGAEGGWSISIPLDMSDELLLAYVQNGEAIRPEQGYPLRLVAPGHPGDHSVKWLKRIYVVDQPHMSRRDEVGAVTSAAGRTRLFRPQMPPKSTITFPSGGLRLSSRGFYEITGLAWSGGGVVRRVEVSTDGGRTWKDAQLQEPVLPKAHTRFRLGWNWQGEEAVLQSRCTDEQGKAQPTLSEMAKLFGVTPEYWKTTFDTPGIFNPVQPWRVNRDGTIDNALFS